MKVLNVVFAVIAGLGFPFLPLILSGRMDWWQGWAFPGVLIVFTFASRILAIRKNPDLAAERAQFTNAPGIKEWDRKLAPWLGYYLPALAYITFGLDARFGWSPQMPVGVAIVGLILFMAGYALATWAMIENRFFSSVVRIQTERGHTVCDTGPYRLVRHPGYAGGLIGWVFMPLFMGSWWSYIPALMNVVVYFIRTRLEDQTLQAELPGYKEYTRRTRYRLIPGVW
jgi:protein-S-isoprenylcysteine O-methyltransferase Ste14